jgi:hypothetical protein
MPLLDSYLEIYNPADAPAPLGGLWLSDEPSEMGRRKWQIPALTFADRLTHSLFTSGSGTSQPSRFLFALAGGGEYVRLGQNDAATTEIDGISFGLPATGLQSEGRVPDGAAAIGSITPSPGAPNSTSPGPAFLAHPPSAAVPLGGAHTLSVLTTPLLSGQWRRNGEPIPGETSATLTFLSVTTADDAEYTYAATDAAGTAVSRPARLTVLSTYNAWAAASGVGSPTADADHDGLTNGGEFLAGTNPLVPAGAAERISRHPLGGSEFIAGTEFLTMTFTRSRRAAYSSLEGELSSDLRSWSAGQPDVIEALSAEPDGDARERLKFAVPPGSRRQFLRLRLTP